MLRHLMLLLIPLLTPLAVGSPLGATEPVDRGSPLDRGEPAERAEPAPRLHPSDEQFLLQMRQQINAQQGRQQGNRTPAVAPPAEQERWFREGLQQAAVNETGPPAPAAAPHPSPDSWGDRPPRAGGPDPHAWPGPRPSPGGPSPPRGVERPDWLAVLEAAMHLEHLAQQLWEEATTVRRAASHLREQAQHRASKGLGHHPDRPRQDGGYKMPQPPQNRY
jgi:hypothetical protein